ncbi:MAG: efflux RND transporter periplasmic adaptor subunit [Planctomycetaceae bacterium]
MISIGKALRSRWLWGIGMAALILIGFATRAVWWEPGQAWVRNTISGSRKVSPLDSHDHGSSAGGEDPHAHEGHDHGHDEGTSLALSAQAQGNIGLSPEYLQPVKLETFRRSITVPGIIVGRPGRTRLEISTPMAGVITHVHAVQGEAVDPGTLLFELRITAEELVSTQTNLLRTVGELDVENREIARLSKVTESGAVSQKTLLERQYAKEKLEVLMNAQREALRLHGLSERQIDDITKNHKLLRDLQIVAPGRDQHGAEELILSRTEVTPVSLAIRQERQLADENAALDDAHSPDASKVPLILQEVLVHKGETVAAGATLGALADYSELYIEGRAFEQDLDVLSQSALRNWKITAVFEGAANSVKRIENLDLVYSASEIDAEARSLSFFVRLPNEVAREVPSPNGQRFLDWKYRPGQRLQLLVPVEEWENQIVLPVDAIAREGAESFVFQQNGNHFDRVSVRVAYRDSTHVVVASDGSIFPGDVIALRGAHQMQMALKNKSGGGVDPHAGHNH